jgi:serralysin
MSTNERHYCICMTPEDLSEEDKARLRGHKAALLRSAKWGIGDTITVCFLDDGAQRFGARAAEQLQERVKKVALEWTKLANLTLDFRNRDRPISGLRSRTVMAPGPISGQCAAGSMSPSRP